MFVNRFTASCVDGRGQFLIAIDELTVAESGSERLVRDVIRLIDEAEAMGAKLVLTCNQQLWELLQMPIQDASRRVFSFGTDDALESSRSAVASRTEGFSHEAARALPVSFRLGPLTVDELDAILERRLPPKRLAAVKRLLHDDRFVILRTPFYLDSYLTQHLDEHDVEEAPTPNVDGLLDGRVELVLRQCARRRRQTIEDLLPEFDRFVQELWKSRPLGVTYRLACEIMGGDVVADLREAGLITTDGRVRIVERLVEDRVFARLALGQIAAGDDLASLELIPDQDHSVVSAMLRSANSPVELAQQLMAHDRAWQRTVANGLAQVTRPDERILAFLSVMDRPRRDTFAEMTGARALGLLSAQDHRAWRWVTQMFLSDRLAERHLGELALSYAIELAPRRVEAALRVRLARALCAADREERDYWLKGLLSPLLGVRDRHGAAVGRRVLARYETALSPDGNGDIDAVVGKLAFYGDQDEAARFIRDLGSDDIAVRLRAARAVGSMVLENPGRFAAEICAALRSERDPDVLSNLLWFSHPLIGAHAADLLDALEGRDWTQEHPRVVGSFLALLAEVCPKDPARVRALLPNDLSTLGATDRAALSGIFAYASWRCAQNEPSARERIATLIAGIYYGASADVRTLALRGAAIARLALVARDAGVQIEGGEPDPAIFGLAHGLVIQVNTTPFVRRCAEKLRGVRGLPHYVRHLLSAFATTNWAPLIRVAVS